LFKVTDNGVDLRTPIQSAFGLAADRPVAEPTSTVVALHPSDTKSLFRRTTVPTAIEISEAHIFNERLIPSREPDLTENVALMATLK